MSVLTVRAVSDAAMSSESTTSRPSPAFPTTVPEPDAVPEPDLMQRDFTANRPNTRYVGDVFWSHPTRLVTLLLAVAAALLHLIIRLMEESIRRCRRSSPTRIRRSCSKRPSPWSMSPPW